MLSLFFTLHLLFATFNHPYAKPTKASVFHSVTHPTDIKLVKVWESDTLLRTPESVLYYGPENVLFVSCIDGKSDAADGQGFIAKVSLEGKIVTLNWVKGLNAPKGLGIYKNTLYVSDIDQLVVIDLKTGNIKEKLPVPSPAFLNDVTVDAKGVVYVSDSRNNKIYFLQGHTLKVFIEGENLYRPNGLLAEKDRLLIGSVNNTALRYADWKTKQITEITNGLGAADGVVSDGKNNYFVSDWNGQVFWVSTTGDKKLLLTTLANKINSADIEYIPAKKLLLVPTFNGNRVVAYRVEE
jgi:outer membrane protein assembly factor BamB